MNRQKSTSAFLLIGGAALAAMTAGHALVLAVSQPGSYRHVAQIPAIELSAVLVLGATVLIVGRTIRSVLGGPLQSDWALPAFSTIQALGPARLIPAVLALQALALFAGESLEQRAAGVALGGFAGLFGSTLWFAPFVHVAVGIGAAFALWFAACEIRAHARAAVAFVRAALAWLPRDVRPVVCERDRNVSIPSALRLQPLALKIANRPPPASVRLA